VHGVEDDVVPVAQSRDYATREPSAELLELAGLDHFDVVDVEHPAWAATRDWLSTRLGAEVPRRMDARNSAVALEQLIERYNDAWNAHDLDAILSLHAPGMVFENH